MWIVWKQPSGTLTPLPLAKNRHRLGSEGRVDGAKLDVGEDDIGTGSRSLNGCWHTRSRCAGTASGALRSRANRVGRVQPQHIGVVVVPQRHDEDHTRGQRLAHGRQPTFALEVSLITKGGLLRVAVSRGDGVVACHAGDGGLGVGDEDAVLDVEALDFGQCTAGLDELGNDGEDVLGVDGQAGPVEGGVALAVAVEVASIGVAFAVVAVGCAAVGSAAGVTVADFGGDGCAWVSGEGR